MAAAQQMPGMNPMMMQQMAYGAPPPQGQQQFMKGAQQQQQYRLKQSPPGGMPPQGQPNPGMKGGPMMYNNQQMGAPYMHMQGNLMNTGHGPSRDMIFPNQSGPSQQTQRHERN